MYQIGTGSSEDGGLRGSYIVRYGFLDKKSNYLSPEELLNNEHSSYLMVLYIPKLKILSTCAESLGCHRRTETTVGIVCSPAVPKNGKPPIF